MRLNRKALLGTVAAVALGGSAMGMSSDAQALEKAYWNWDLYIDTNVYENIHIDVNWEPLGKIIDQVVQIQLGDVTADSHVTNVYNWKPLQQVEGKVGYNRAYDLTVDGGGSYKYAKDQANSGSDSSSSTSHSSSSYDSANSFDGQLHGNLTTQGDGVPFFIGGVGTGSASAPPLIGSASAKFGFIGAYATEGTNSADVVATADGHLNTSGSQSSSTEGSKSSQWASQESWSGSGSGSFSGYFGFTESDITNFYAMVPAIQDATAELPKVTSTAFAAGNVISIDPVDVGVQEHSLQVVADVNSCVEGCSPDFTRGEYGLATNYRINGEPVDLATENNLHNTGVFFAGLGITGVVKKADITATSYVDDILNAQADSSATAFGNYKSINVDTTNGNNGIAWADATQVSIADVSATSWVGGPGVYDSVLAADELSILQPRYVGGIHLVNYTGLGGVDIAKSTATAIGNVLNVKVSSGQTPTPTPTPTSE
jgi:hypothetical protein